LAGALLFDEKIRQILVWSWNSSNIGILQYSTQEPSSKEEWLTLPHFWSLVWQKGCGLCPCNPSAEEVGGLDGFL
jgi:hypothetical protein